MTNAFLADTDPVFVSTSAYVSGLGNAISYIRHPQSSTWWIVKSESPLLVTMRLEALGPSKGANSGENLLAISQLASRGLRNVGFSR